MNAFTIASLVGIAVILVGILLALFAVWFSRLVTRNQLALATQQAPVNLSLTLGHQIPIDADYEEQRKAARKEAARRAAAQPRWANAAGGSLGAAALRTASENLEADPQSAVRIAEFHTWEGARTGIPAADAAQAPAAAAAAPVVVTKSPKDLKPGIDYPFTEISDDMSPADKRKARIANSKARSAAVKALKAAGVASATAQVEGQVAAAPAAAVPTAAVVSIPEPEYVELTDDMSPDEKRKARISNAKAKSAYKKALKAAGVTAAAAQPEAAQPAPAAVAAPPAAAEAAPSAVAEPAIPRPELVEISDEMPPNEKRAARIANAKAKSAYKKALKAAGIDPASVDLG